MLESLKGKLTNEEAKEMASEYRGWSKKICDENCELHCLYCFLKEQGIIKKCAEEEMEEYYNLLFINRNTWDKSEVELLYKISKLAIKEAKESK
jgi:hypothetical protein